MRKVWVWILCAVVLCGAVFGAYAFGRERGKWAVLTAEGWIDENREGVAVFVVEVDGNFYEWFVDEE